MKYILLVVVVALCVTSAFAQSPKIQFGLSGSTDQLWYRDSDDFAGASYVGRSGFSAGPFVRLQLTKNISFDGGVNYSRKTARRSASPVYIPYPNNPSQGEVRSFHTDYRHTYLDIPLEVNIAFAHAGPVAFYWSGGLVTSIFLDYQETSNYDKTYDDYDESFFKKSLTSFKTGVGVQVNLRKIAFSLEPQMRFFLSEVHDGQQKKPVHVGLELGVIHL